MSLQKFFLLVIIPLLLVFNYTKSAAQEVDDYVFAVLPAPALKYSNHMMPDSVITKYVSRVGGVSFDKTARPDKKFKIESISFRYEPEKADGQRFELNINGQNTRVSLFDWELIPIARYSNSPWYSCFTYFGELEDKTLGSEIIKNEGHILNYHPEFENTLLGMRIAYMDLLYMYPFTSDLPRKNGKYVIGAGEEIPDTMATIGYRIGFQNLIYQIQTELEQQFRSYVICDYNREITFSAENGVLELTSNPYYYCWRYAMDNPEFDQEKKVQEIEASYKKRLQELKEENSYYNARTLYIDSLISVINYYHNNIGEIDEGHDLFPIVSLEDIDKKQNYVEQFSNQSIYETLIYHSFYNESQKIEFLEEYSDRISENIKLLKGLNPAVWNATVKTMQYSAFFRYLKTNYPSEWESFVNAISSVSPEPAFITPTVLYERNNKTVSGLIDAIRP